MTHHLVPEYHRARQVVVIAAAFVFLWKAGIPFEGKIPLINITLSGQAKLPYVLGFVLGYGLFRVLIEWTQSEPERRRRFASRLDLGLTLLLGGFAGWLLGSQILPRIDFPSVWWVSSAALVAVGIAVGELINTSLFNLFFIRSKEEASRLALPRVPVAVRATYRMAYITVPALLIVLLLAPSFSAPMSSVWPWLLCSPIVFLPVSGATALLLRRHTKPDGTSLSREEFIKGLWLAFDRHDAHYQLGGWDKPIPPSNSPLYQAAERGDSATVRELLSAATDPDERNMHGWTPLIIAVAQQHLGTARLLLESGADPNRSNLFGRNPLMFAARYGNEELVHQLLEHGAKPDLNESNDPSALSAAAGNGHLAVVRSLLEGGADPTFRDDDGRSPLDYAEAAAHGDVAALLRRAMRDREA